MFCQYSELFGKIKTGVHQYRLFDLAIADSIMTFIGAYFLQKVFFKKNTYWEVLLILFISGIILHRLFCVETTIDKLIFKN